MASKRLTRVHGLDRTLVESLAKAGTHTCKDVLSLNILELMKLTGSYQTSCEIFESVSTAVAPHSKTAFELVRVANGQALNTSLKMLDTTLKGGIPYGTITEITGPPGCGKTQFCLMMSVIEANRAFLGGEETGVIYIDTESAFSAERLLEIATNKYPDIYQSEEACIKLAERVYIYVESTVQSLMSRLESIEQIIITKNVKLLVLDSIASLVRKEYGNEIGLVERNKALVKQATILKYLAETFNMPVLVTNQVTTRIGKSLLDQQEEDIMEEESFLTAALGNTWAHAVNTRLVVQFVDSKLREILIAKSPVAPQLSYRYIIQASGIVLVDNEEKASKKSLTLQNRLPIQSRTTQPVA